VKTVDSLVIIGHRERVDVALFAFGCVG
jgi:hypothetical protein